MLEQKAFLQAACENVHRLLDGVLRFEYATHINERVFATLKERVSHLEHNLENAPLQGLAALAADLGRVAEVVAQVEKSHLGEISWAFVDHFAPLANLTCLQNPAPSLMDAADKTDDLQKKETIEELEKLNRVHFFFSSNGNLYSYLLHRERRGHDQGGAKIFNLQFPRAFKESVLLHGLLAHELGHALVDINKGKWVSLIQSAFSDTALALNTDIEPNIPPDVAVPDKARDWVCTWRGKQVEVNRTHVQSITEEIFCDVVGLLLAGPSFIFALAQLLWAIDPVDQGRSQLPAYPSFRVRITTLLDAVKFLKWDQLIDQEVWAKIAAYAFSQQNDGPALLSQVQIQQLVEKIKAELPKEVLYGPPNRAVIDAVKLDLLDRVPPSVTRIAKSKDQNTLTVAVQKIDFRDILLAAWEVTTKEPLPPSSELKKRTKTWHQQFNQINQLSEKALTNLLATNQKHEVAS